MEACFKDHYAFREIIRDDSIFKSILNSDTLKRGDSLYIPYLILFGVLFCSSNNTLKVSKFYELCQIELDPIITAKDKELVDLVPKLFEMSYDMMI